MPNGKTRKEAYAYVWEEIIKRVENPSLSRQGEIGAAVKSIEGWFKTMRDMQVESGVDIGDQGPDLLHGQVRRRQDRGGHARLHPRRHEGL